MTLLSDSAYVFSVGIAGSEPADPVSMGVANRLLDRPSDAPCYEIVLRGGEWRIEGRGTFALAGADMHWRLDDRPLPYPCGHIPIDGTHRLSGGYVRWGCRAYLAMTDKKIPETTAAHLPPEHWLRPLPVPVTAGPELKWLTAAESRAVIDTVFRVGAASNRQGLRLDGFRPRRRLPEMISSPVLPGTVQLSPDGPILLGPDAQTIGGYPRILVADGYPAAAFQLRSGEALRFVLK